MAIPTQQELDLLHANLCSALSDTKRILILYTLYDGPRNVTSLAETIDMPQPTVSRHLRVLRQRGLVLSERDGPSVVYRVSSPEIIAVIDKMRSLVRSIVEKRANVYDS